MSQESRDEPEVLEEKERPEEEKKTKEPEESEVIEDKKRHEEGERSENELPEEEMQENELTEEGMSNIDLSKKKEELFEKNKTVKNKLPMKETPRVARAAKWSSRELKHDIPEDDPEKELTDVMNKKSGNESSKDDLSEGET